MSKMIGERQHRAWLAAGASAVAAAGLCGMSWLWVLLGSLSVSGIYIYIDKRLEGEGLAQRLERVMGFPGKVLSVFLMFWLIIAMGWSACLADVAFPSVDGFPGLGLVLLGLAAWGAYKGPRACAGCAGIVCLLLAVLYAVIFVFSLPNVTPAYLVPAADSREFPIAAGLAVLPFCVRCMPAKRRMENNRLFPLLLPVAAAGLSAVCSGVLSYELAAASAAPAYGLAQSVSVLGVIERIEPLLSAAMTMGIFCLLSAQACACRALADGIWPWRWSGSLCCLAAAVAMFPAAQLPKGIFAVGNLLFFLLLPVAAAAAEKKIKKEKKDVDKGEAR